MTIEIGARLGPYEIEEAVGAGGMGEVYRARDTRLERSVAIKVLPAHLAESPALRQRLDREAKAISSLSHPHICPLYDVGHEDGVDYLVMEFIEGETLADRLSRGPLPIEEVLRFGVQIADALEKAHRQGIIHRDLKPGNVMLTTDGAKLLDFGLAKADGVTDGDDADLTVSPTVSKPLTAAGTIIGTYQYMAPEQLEGKAADARTDIFALGALLYEMAAGRRAFLADTQASLIGAIMHEAPDPVSTIQPMTPPAFDRVVQTCLAKDAEDRWQTAHDVKLQLEWIAEGGSVVGLPAPVAARRKSRERLAWAMAGVAALATAVFAVGFLSRAPQPLKQSRFEIPPPPGLTQVGSPRISPDGRHIAFIAVDGEGNSQIWLRPLDSIEARPLAGTEGAGDTRPIWSPDSRHIAFFVANKLKKVPVSGGPAQTISDVNGADGSWSNKGEIVFDGGPGDPLRRVSASGGVAKAEITLEERKDVTGLGWPEFLPDGRRFLYISDTLGDSSMITLHTLGEDEDVPLAPADSRVQYVEPGYLIYVIDGMLVAHPFDSGGGKLTGEPIPLADNVGATTVGLADFSASAEGTLVFRSGESGGRRLLWFDRDGRELGALAEGADFADSWFSPDGKKVVTAIRDNESANMDLWIHDLDRDVMSRFTFDPGVDQNPLWSPDGSKIVFSSNRSESQGLYLKDASGVGAVEPLLEAEENMYPGDWSRDGRVLLFGKVVSETSWDIWALPTDGSGDSFALVQSEFVEVRPTFSPDGKWFAYQSNESGREEIYVRQFPGPGGQWQVSTNGGVEPIWSADGSEIFYLDGSRDLVSVPVTMGATFEAGLPQKLFDPEVFGTIQRSRFAVTRDGQRFLVLTSMSGEAIRPATVVLNWHAGLEN